MGKFKNLNILKCPGFLNFQDFLLVQENFIFPKNFIFGAKCPISTGRYFKKFLTKFNKNIFGRFTTDVKNIIINLINCP